jgi:hypothetical protein
MAVTSLEVILGLTSGAFPLAGKLGKLEGFYPHLRRNLYVVISTIFSLLVYTFCQFSENFQVLPFCIHPAFLGVWAFGFLIIYLVIHLQLKDKYRLNELPRAGKTAYIIVTMFFYVLFVSSITFAFNAMENYKDYTIVKGTISLESEPITHEVNIRLRIDGKDDESFISREDGTFCFTMKTEKFNTEGVVVFTFDKDGRSFSRTKGLKELPRNQEWKIELLPTMGHKTLNGERRF